MQKPCPEADSGAINERMNQVEEVVGKLLNDMSVVKNKQNAMKEDLTDNRQYTTSKYHELRVDTNHNLEAANTKCHALRQSYEELSETLDKRTKISGATYVRWGRTTCPADTESVYTGYAGGSYYSHKGAAVSMLCLPMVPQWHMHSDGLSNNGGFVYGAEYEPGPRMDQFFGKGMGQQDVPCVVCNIRRRTSTIMIPGKTSCHAGWNLEYSGYLMSGYYNHDAATDYYCVDKDAEALPGGVANENGKLLYFVEARCGSLECPPYKDGWELACVVCSK